MHRLNDFIIMIYFCINNISKADEIKRDSISANPNMMSSKMALIIYGKGYRAVLRNCDDSQIHEREFSKGGVYYGKRKLVGIGLSLPMSVMRR